MLAHPTVILHTDRPAAATAVLGETHPDLTVHACDTYAALPALIEQTAAEVVYTCLLYTSPSPRDGLLSRMPSSA